MDGKSIDLLITDESTFLLGIENKIKAKEGKNQLANYFNSIEKNFSHIPNRFYIFLTQFGDTPSDEENWISMNYTDIEQILIHLVSITKSISNEILEEFLKQYIYAIRRYILMEDKKVIKFCQEIYREHKDALDLIFEYRLDKSQIIKDILIEKVKNHSDIIELDNYTRTKIKFASKKLDKLFKVKGSDNWSLKDRVILFEFKNHDNSNNKLEVFCIIGPTNDIAYRTMLYNLVKDEPEYSPYVRKLASKHNTFWKMEFLDYDTYINLSITDLEIEIDEKFKVFIQELKCIESFFEKNLK